MKSLSHPTTALVAAAVAIGVGLRALFLSKAAWIWQQERPLALGSITPWARPVLTTRDGAESPAMLGLVLLQLVLTGLAAWGICRLERRWRAAAVVMLLTITVWFLWKLPPKPPLYQIADYPHWVWVVGLALGAAAWLSVRAAGGRGRVPVVAAALLVPICFVATTLPSLLDVPCIFAPALRLEQGVPPAAMYMQYDLFPSLLALAWHQIGGVPIGFGLVCAASYYALIIGLLVLGRRFFTRPQLAAWLAVALVLVRIYGVALDASATPEATPIRLDLWPILLALSLARGLRHLAVGIVLAAMFVFSRSMATLYLGAYLLALGADFFSRRWFTQAPAAPLVQDARATLRQIAPSLAALACGILAARLIFGEFVPEAVRLYHGLGVGMMRVEARSFYWWLMPLTGMAGWLAFARRKALRPDDPRAQARIFAVALVVVNSIYFFGRSHEHNLINLSPSFLFLAVMVIDLAWPSPEEGALVLERLFRLAPWVLVATCAYAYSERVWTKVGQQIETLEGARAQVPFPGDVAPSVDCAEIRRLAGDDQVFFFAKHDFWYYDACHLTPRGRIQPLLLVIRLEDLRAQVSGLLDAGYKMVVPRAPREWSHLLPELAPVLVNRDMNESASYRVYRRR